MNLLRVDSAAALLAGMLTAVLAPVLAGWYSLPESVLAAIAIANLLYGGYSGWLASRPCPRPLQAIVLLVIANVLWTVVCLALAAVFWDAASGLGLAHLLVEGAFVSALASTEWRQRRRLQTQA